MKKLVRPSLPQNIARYLIRKTQAIAAGKPASQLWKQSRGTKMVEKAVAVLHQMNQGRQHCFYCGASEGTDIDHFEPISANPTRGFDWSNWNYACSACNSNHKRDQFPLGLLNPTDANYRLEQHFDFNHQTGALLLLTPEAHTSEPIYALNRPFLNDARYDSFRTCQSSIIQYARFRHQNQIAQASIQEKSSDALPHHLFST